MSTKIPVTAAAGMLISFLFFSFSGSGAVAQQRLQGTTPAPAAVSPPDNAGSKAYGGYLIGVGDIVNIRIAEEDDASGRYQVDEAGDIKLPLLGKPVHAAGLTTFEFSKQLADALKEQQILKEPYVTAFIERGMTQNVTLVGPVARPGIYPIERPTRLLDVLSMGGGLLPTAGQTITITHPVTPQSSNTPYVMRGGVTEVSVATLMSGENQDANVELHPGDQISVAGASVIYVVGAVTRPGAFAVTDPRSGLSVLRAIALVEGTQPTASLGKTIIVRKSTSDSSREEIPVELDKIMKGKAKDPILLANDILFVPQSGFKRTMRKMGDIAAQAAGEMAGYGLALRIAP